MQEMNIKFLAQRKKGSKRGSNGQAKVHGRMNDRQVPYSRDASSQGHVDRRVPSSIGHSFGEMLVAQSAAGA